MRVAEPWLPAPLARVGDPPRRVRAVGRALPWLDVTPSALGSRSLRLDWGTSYEVTVFDLGLACCGVEVMAALQDPRPDLAALGVTPSSAPDQAHVLVVSGTVTDVMLPAVVAAYQRMPEPRYVLSVGACSNTGGPYWDSYSVTKGIDQVLPVHVAVPGCPPRPEALLEGLVALHRLVTAEERG
jgi:NADH-quinone oxidoreductase subunit B